MDTEAEPRLIKSVEQMIHSLLAEASFPWFSVREKRDLCHGWPIQPMAEVSFLPHAKYKEKRPLR